MNFIKNTLIVAGMLSLAACAEKGPQEITIGKDQCDNCKMTISEPKYATQLLTEKGRVYKFDDIACLRDYEATNPENTGSATVYVADFPSGKFVESSTATFIKGGQIKSPMGGNTQAYSDKAAAEKAASELGATLTNP
ncbi:copper chaperone NosL [Kaistella treverensis]|uniref:Copper chaperone NosL n=1 Tax=Kaistella treverensis TaxID=631455 RepID=A0A1I3N1D5_9FLAO|nr:nitrous oxide reductase accessory protein NosL [Kaistella treverensis]SFJ03164.1 copper chaperone NosL [Kaistella treverensis]